jgi:small redox-active disulfide protein 2
VEDAEEDIVKIEILGTGCPKCETVAKNVRTAVTELGLSAEILKVTDIDEIIARGVMLTPALSVDGELKAVGKIPNVEEIKAWLAGE